MTLARRLRTVAVVAAAPIVAAAQTRTPIPAGRDLMRAETVAPGVLWRHIVRSDGPWVINVVTIDLRNGAYDLRQVRALDSLRGREKVSSMVARAPGGADGVLVAINADFFNLTTGEAENNQVIAGEWWKGVRVADSPFEAFPTVRTQFALDSARRPLLDRFQFDAVAIDRSVTLPILGLNFLSRSGPEATALYTERIGTTPRDTVRKVAEARLIRAGTRADTTFVVRRGAIDTVSGHPVARGEAVLAGYGARAAAVAKLPEGDTIRIVMRARTPTTSYPSASPARGAATRTEVPLALLIGGWPRILRNGENVAGRSASDEGTLSGNAEVRHPRSAIGFSRDSSTLVIVTVDGRQESSVGMTLVELASLMREFGAWDALNFDGGGSTTLVVRGKVVNAPSDKEGERPVANALFVVKRAP